MYNHGKMKRDFAYINDIVSSILGAYEASYLCEIFNLGNQLSEELQGVANLIENILIKKQRPNICQCSPVMSPSVLQIYTRLRKSWTLSPLQILILGSRNLLNGIWIINKI